MQLYSNDITKDMLYISYKIFMYSGICIFMTVSVKKKDCICIINYINILSASLKQNKCCPVLVYLYHCSVNSGSIFVNIFILNLISFI